MPSKNFTRTKRWETFGSEAREGDTQFEASPTCYLTFRERWDKPVPRYVDSVLVGAEIKV